MVALPPQVLELAKHPDTCKILTTINEDGTPHSIVCGTLFVPDAETIGVGKVWLGTTSRNIALDRRAEVLLWKRAQAFSIQVRFREISEDPAVVGIINEKLEHMNMKVDSVLMFEPLSVTDEGMGPNVGTRIV